MKVMSKRRICVVTGSRAEYGLLYWLIKEIQEDKELELQLIVTGTHLSEEFGNTYKEIQKDFKIDAKVKLPLEDDSAVGISKAMGIAQYEFSKIFQELKPNIVVILGDRYEILSVAISAMLSNIPIAHLHGGEITEGAIDESIRHSISKMSHLHFSATKQYRDRVIQLGENPSRVFNSGGLGIDNINKLKLLNKKEFEKSINFKLGKKNILVTYHPVTLEQESTKQQFQNLLNVLDELEDTKIIFTKANSDSGGKIINAMIDKYVQNNSNTIAFISLGQLRYLSALQYVDAIVGNSSSGLLEAPSFKIGTINIGNRQQGRIKAKSVLSCTNEKQNIKEKFQVLYSSEFQKILLDVDNPYGIGGTSQKIKSIIKNFNLENILIKSFYNMN